MKKTTCLFLCFFAFTFSAFSQAVLQVEAPLNNGSTTQQRAPNGTAPHAFMRACALVLANELSNLPANSTISNFGFTLQTGTSGTPVTGNFTVYLQNTADATYLKGTNWATILTGMTSVYANVMTIPLSAGTTSIMLTLSTPFLYTGGGLYVAYDWTCTGPYTAGTIATYYSESAVLNPGCASAASSVSSPTLLATTAFRPSFLFQAANTYTNDIQVLGIEAQGKVPLIFNTPQTVSALIKNGSNATLNNILVNLNVSGANVAGSNVSISSLAAGATTLVGFTPYVASNQGLNTISVSVNSDQNNNNNSRTYAQLVNCNLSGNNPGAGSYTSGAVGYGAGAGILATTLFNAQTATLSGINFAVSNNTAAIGGNIYGVLMTPGGAILAASNTITITAPMLSTFQEFVFANPPALTAATNYVLGVAQMVVGTSTYYPAGTQATSYMPNALYLTAGIAGGALTPLAQNFGYFGIEAIYQHTANVSISASPSLICIGSSANLQALGPVANYTWSTGSNLSGITVTPNITSVYSVVTTNSIGCKSSATATIGVSNLPNVTASSNSPSVCVGGSITLTASGAITYTWSSGPTGSSIVEFPTANTNYTVTGANAAGCTNIAVVVINVFEPVFTVSSNTTACGNNPVTLSASGPANYSYLWSNNSPFPTITVTLSSSTVFSVTATDQNLCSKTQTVGVTVVPNPTVLATASRTSICRNENQILVASGANSYSWSTSATGTSVVITGNTNGTFTYSVTGTDANNCSNTATISIKVNACLGTNELNGENTVMIVYPNPTQNDVTISFDKPSENLEIQIYNPLGQMIVKSHIKEQNTRVSLGDFPAGVYLIKIYQNGEAVGQKKIIKN
jgi:hypothetical protein